MKTFSKRAPATALFLLALSSVSVLAADARAPQAAPGQSFEARFSLADKDKSGGLSRNEIAAAPAPGFPAMAKGFDAMDANKDGQVTLAERNGAIKSYLQNQQARRVKAQQQASKDLQERFAKADGNRDGALSREELNKAAAPGFPVMQQNFAEMDKDRNGKLTLAERDGFLKAEAARQAKAQQAKAQGNFADAFTKADANMSGGLSKKEVENAAKPGFPLIRQNFDAMDTDKNGQVSMAERDAFMRRR